MSDEAELAPDPGLPPDTEDVAHVPDVALVEGVEGVNLDEPEQFRDQIKFISLSRSGSKDQPYAFVVVGKVYVPGYMVRQYPQLRVGDWLAGMCKVAPPDARNPYRAISVEAVDVMSAKDGYGEEEDGGEVEEDMGSSDGVMPTGALRSADDDQSDASDEQANAIARSMLEYIEKHGGGVSMSGPPHQVGVLANFYKQDPAGAETIKSWQIADSKPGVQSFVRSFPSLLAIVGRHPNQKIVGAKPSPARAAGQEAEKKSASNGTQGNNGAASKGSPGSAKRAAGKTGAADVKAAQNATARVSKAAMEAAARASDLVSSPSKKSSKAGKTQKMDMHEQLKELRSDLEVAMGALACAQQRMERIDAAMRADDG